MQEAKTEKWALILGASGGFGAASARALARRGYGIFGLHLDTSERMAEVTALLAELERVGVPAKFWNVNAAREAIMHDVVSEIAPLCKGTGGVRVLLHAIAFGTLGPFIRTRPDEPIVGSHQLAMTMNIMAHSLVYWVQALCEAQLLEPGARVFALTSRGSTNVYRGYGAVSAAKSALESHVRQLAVELAPHGVAVNALRPGVTITPALMKIPGAEGLIAHARELNPHGRLTTPAEVGEAIALLADASLWVTGNVIGVDGGEQLTL